VDRTEFTRAMAYVGTATGKPLSGDALEVYFDLLGDLEYATLMLAVKRVLVEHRWANFPTVAELRQAAVETLRGEASELSESEAWAMAWRIVGDTDPEVEGSFTRACDKASAPPLVIEAVRSMGLNPLCYGHEPVGVLRGQFLKTYGQLAGRERRLALLPPAVRAGLAEIRARRMLPAGSAESGGRATPSPVVREAIGDYLENLGQEIR
jgi:hypothetical protein